MYVRVCICAWEVRWICITIQYVETCINVTQCVINTVYVICITII